MYYWEYARVLTVRMSEGPSFQVAQPDRESPVPPSQTAAQRALSVPRQSLRDCVSRGVLQQEGGFARKWPGLLMGWASRIGCTQLKQIRPGFEFLGCAILGAARFVGEGFNYEIPALCCLRPT